MTAAFIAIAAVVVILLFLLSASIRIAREYERGVIFRLGRLHSPPKGPGLFLLIPVVDKMVRVDLRTVTLNIPPQEVITKDNVPVRVNAVAYFRIIDPEKAIVQVENFMVATSQIAQTTLRSVLGQHQLDELLSERDKINSILQQIIDDATSPWGVKVSIVEVKDVEIPSGMQRAMARQAEAERERRAKVIAAEGEYQASERLKDAADVMSGNATTLQLRFLQTMLRAHLEHRLQEAELQRRRVPAHHVGRVLETFGRLVLALGRDHLRAPLALGLGLAGHGPLHAARDLDVLDLDDRDLHAPGRSGVVDDLLQDRVDLVALGQELVQLVLAEDATERRLRDLRGGDHEVLDLHDRLLGIDDAEVGDGVHADRDVVLRDHLLRRDVERHRA